MNTNAANALLKTLEEPSGNLLIILVSHKPQQLLPTILSRLHGSIHGYAISREKHCLAETARHKRSRSATGTSRFCPFAAMHFGEEGAAAEEYNRFLQEIRQPAKFRCFWLWRAIAENRTAKVIHWLQQWCYDLSSAKLTEQLDTILTF